MRYTVPSSRIFPRKPHHSITGATELWRSKWLIFLELNRTSAPVTGLDRRFRSEIWPIARKASHEAASTPSLSRWTTANDFRHYPSLASDTDNAPNASFS